MKQQNHDLKQYAKQCGVKQWEIAEEMGVREESLSRKLRKEFTSEQKQQFRQAVDKLKRKGGVSYG